MTPDIMVPPCIIGSYHYCDPIHYDPPYIINPYVMNPYVSDVSY